jgi:hypothetical protein
LVMMKERVDSERKLSDAQLVKLHTCNMR